MIGKIPDNISDEKPAIVVITAKKVGFDIDDTVCRISSF
jgi:hypothetical protein